jgi:hypothetical protein
MRALLNTNLMNNLANIIVAVVVVDTIVYSLMRL